MKYERMQGYILEQFARTRKKESFFKVYWTKESAKKEIQFLPKDGRPAIYKVTVWVNEPPLQAKLGK